MNPVGRTPGRPERTRADLDGSPANAGGAFSGEAQAGCAGASTELELKEIGARKALHGLAESVLRHPRWFFYSQLALALLCLGYTVLRLQFSTDKNDLISVHEPYRRRFLDFKAEFAPQDNLFVLCESDAPEKGREFIERLGARLMADSHFTNVYYRAGLELMGSKALLFLPESTLQEFHGLLRDHREVLRTLSLATNLESLFMSVNRECRRLAQRGGGDLTPGAWEGTLPALQSLIDRASHSIVSEETPPAPDIVGVFGGVRKGGADDRYLTYDQGRIHVLITQPWSAGQERAAIRRLRQLIEETRPEVTGVNVEITGEAVLRGDEMEQARRDTEVAAMLSLALTGLLFVCSCRVKLRPLMATFCLLVGLCYTLGFATLAVGSLNILSITLVPILIGLAIDYGVHLIFRYEELIGGGHTPKSAVRRAVGFTGLGILSSALIIAASFYFMVLMGFKGIREMGLVAGSGILICLLPMLTMLPLLLVRAHRMPSHPPSRDGSLRRSRIEQFYLRHPGWMLICGAVFTAFMLREAFDVQFNYNLLDLQSRSSPAVRMQRRLIESGEHSLLYCAVIAESLPQAMEWERRIRQLPSVGRVVSLVRFLGEDQEGKLAAIHAIRREVDGVPVPEVDPRPVDLPRLNQTLFSTGGYLGRAIEILERRGVDGSTLGRLRGLRASVTRLRFLTADDELPSVDRLTSFQRGLLGSLRETLTLIREQNDHERLLAQDVPPFVRDRFIGSSGRYLLQVYPREDVWQRAEQERFIRELMSVAPNVTGSPVLFYEYTTRLKESVQRSAAYAAVIVAVLLLVHFRQLSSALLAMLPVLVGFCWTLGLMGWLGISFNPVNVMSVILLIGIGVANGVHILNRFAEEPQPVILAKSTGKAVLVSALSTMAGFGSLMVAKHQGIASLGAVMTLGTCMCTVAALAVLPAALKLLCRVGWRPIGR